MNINHHNWEYDFNGDTTVPASSGDRQWAQDKIRDFFSLKEHSGKAIASIFGSDANTILSGGVVTQGTGDSVSITALMSLIKQSVEVPLSFPSTPPTKQSKDIPAFVEFSALTSKAVTGGQIDANHYANATLDGSTVNYVKIKYKDLDGSTRQRAEATGTYVYDVTPSYELRIEPAAASVYEIVLASFSGAPAGVFTFSTATRTRQYVITNDFVNSRIGINNITPGLDQGRFDGLLAAHRYPLINVGCGSDISIADLARKVAEAEQYDGNIVFDTSRPDGTPRKLTDPGRLFALGWRPATDLDRGIALARADFLGGFPDRAARAA